MREDTHSPRCAVRSGEQTNLHKSCGRRTPCTHRSLQERWLRLEDGWLLCGGTPKNEPHHSHVDLEARRGCASKPGMDWLFIVRAPRFPPARNLVEPSSGSELADGKRFVIPASLTQCAKW